jgi:hypothetical protein
MKLKYKKTDFLQPLSIETFGQNIFMKFVEGLNIVLSDKV